MWSNLLWFIQIQYSVVNSGFSADCFWIHDDNANQLLQGIDGTRERIRQQQQIGKRYCCVCVVKFQRISSKSATIFIQMAKDYHQKKKAVGASSNNNKCSTDRPIVATKNKKELKKSTFQFIVFVVNKVIRSQLALEQLSATFFSLVFDSFACFFILNDLKGLKLKCD